MDKLQRIIEDYKFYTKALRVLQRKKNKKVVIKELNKKLKELNENYTFYSLFSYRPPIPPTNGSSVVRRNID